MTHKRITPISLALLSLVFGSLLVGAFFTSFPAQASSLADTLPIVPTISEGMKTNLRTVFANGQALGNHADVFVKVGDSITASGSFLDDVGCPSDPQNTFGGLAPIVSYFTRTTVGTSSVWCGVSNSFTKDSRAAASGWRSNALLTVAVGDAGVRTGCNSGETQLTCELRQSKPAFALIMTGTNDVDGIAAGDMLLSDYRAHLNSIIDQNTQAGVIPVLSTIPPRLDTSGSLQNQVAQVNQIIIEVGQAKNIPVWNYWRALQSIGSANNFGMDSDGIHPSVYRSDQASIMEGTALNHGYNMRNFTALQVLAKLKTTIIDNGVADSGTTMPTSVPAPTPTPTPTPTPAPTPISSIPIVPVTSSPAPVTSYPAPVTPSTVVTPTFTVSATPVNPSIIQGTTVGIDLAIQRVSNFRGNVRFSYDRLPTGVSGSFSPITTTGNTARFTLIASRTARTGNYTVNIRAVSGSITRTIAFPFRIVTRPTPDFIFSSSPSPLTLKPGQAVSTPFAISRLNGFASGIAFSATGLPRGVSMTSFTLPNPTTGGTFRFSANSTAALGTTNVTIRAVSGSIVKTISVAVTVAATPVVSAPTPVPPVVSVPVPTTPIPPVITSGLSYDIGSPTLRDIWVSPTGNDNNSGSSRTSPLATLGAAWRMVPSGNLSGTGYRIMMMSGTYPESALPNYLEQKHGTAQFPIIIQAADGRGTVTLGGDLNVAEVSYFYMIDINIIPGGDAFHCEKCDHVLMRGMRLSGGNRAAHETIKINQSQYVYIEDSDIYGADDNTIDFVAVQYGHVVRNKISNAQDWCMYAKGGSANLRIEGNEIFNCGTGGFTAGQGTGFEFMTSPWLHYEAYGITFVNNVIHDTEGAGIGVNGGYNIVMANNTMYRVGSRDHVIEVVFGGRECDGTTATCDAYLRAGGWGSTNSAGQPIPNKNVYILNNIVLNPSGYKAERSHFAIYNPRTPASGTNIPSPARTDDNLVIKGNIIWNPGVEWGLGIGEQACMTSNPTCNEAQIMRDNAINTIQPQLVNPAGGDFRPTSGSNVSSFPAAALPTLDWSAMPIRPLAPSGSSTVNVSMNRAGTSRSTINNVGAY